MIEGIVTNEGVPIVMLAIRDQLQPAVLDTGFNGDLELPHTLQPFFNPRFLLRQRSLLGAGQGIVEDVYLVDFPFDGQTVTAEATFAPGETILIGTHLLREYRLTIDFVVRTVVLERAA